jgi:hypothetical protein
MIVPNWKSAEFVSAGALYPFLTGTEWLPIAGSPFRAEVVGYVPNSPIQEPLLVDIDNLSDFVTLNVSSYRRLYLSQTDKYGNTRHHPDIQTQIVVTLTLTSDPSVMATFRCGFPLWHVFYVCCVQKFETSGKSVLHP